MEKPPTPESKEVHIERLIDKLAERLDISVKEMSEYTLEKFNKELK